MQAPPLPPLDSLASARLLEAPPSLQLSQVLREAKHANRRDWPVEELAGQLIWPYTDLLVHESGLTMVSIQIRMILIID